MTQDLAQDVEKAEEITDELALAKFYQGTILTKMDAIRQVADEAEQMIPQELMPYPDYADILFYV